MKPFDFAQDKYPRGLSFIEMLVTLAVFTLITGAIVDSVLTFYRANTSSIEQEYQVENARHGIDLLVRDIREASYGADGSYPLAKMGSTSVTFYSDADNNGLEDRVTYNLIGTTFSRNVVAPSGSPSTYVGLGATTTVSQFIRNIDEGSAVFHYYNASTTEVFNPADIASVASITVSLVVDITKQHNPGEFTLKGSATLRNLRSQ